MRTFLLKILTRGSFFFGPWLIRFVAWWIASGYFLFRGTRRRASTGLYRAVFPGRSPWFHLYCSWRQFHSMAGTYSDRIRMYAEEIVPAATYGRESILEAAKEGRGGVIVISHMGSYEIAARSFQDLGLRLLIVMGEKEAKQVARNQRESLAKSGVRVQVASWDGSPFGGLEALKFIREGGFAAFSGDLVWTDPRSLVRVRFFDHEVGFPAGPHLLALISGAPLFTMFTYRSGKNKHDIFVSAPRQVKARSRSERDETIRESVQAYAEALEKMVRLHPFQWYVFEPIFPSVEDKHRESTPRECTCSRL